MYSGTLYRTNASLASSYCAKCGGPLSHTDANYCPHCGAKMRPFSRSLLETSSNLAHKAGARPFSRSLLGSDKLASMYGTTKENIVEMENQQNARPARDTIGGYIIACVGLALWLLTLLPWIHVGASAFGYSASVEFGFLSLAQKITAIANIDAGLAAFVIAALVLWVASLVLAIVDAVLRFTQRGMLRFAPSLCLIALGVLCLVGCSVASGKVSDMTLTLLSNAVILTTPPWLCGAGACLSFIAQFFVGRPYKTR